MLTSTFAQDPRPVNGGEGRVAGKRKGVGTSDWNMVMIWLIIKKAESSKPSLPGMMRSNRKAGEDPDMRRRQGILSWPMCCMVSGPLNRSHL